MRAVNFLISRILAEPEDAFGMQGLRELEEEDREGDRE